MVGFGHRKALVGVTTVASEKVRFGSNDDVAPLKPGEHVLDLGTGTGSVALRAAEAVAPNGRITVKMKARAHFRLINMPRIVGAGKRGTPRAGTLAQPGKVAGPVRNTGNRRMLPAQPVAHGG